MTMCTLCPDWKELGAVITGRCCTTTDIVRRAQLLRLGFLRLLRINRHCPRKGFSRERCVAICITIVVIDGVCNVMIQQNGLQRGWDWKTADQWNDASQSAAVSAAAAAWSALDDIKVVSAKVNRWWGHALLMNVNRNRNILQAETWFSSCFSFSWSRSAIWSS